MTDNTQKSYSAGESNDSGVEPVFIKAPVIKVNEGGSVVSFIEPKDREDELAEAMELLKRYGRLDRLNFVQKYIEAVEVKGEKLFRMPLVVVTNSEEKADGQFYRYALGAEARRIGVSVNNQSMQLKPEVVHFDGLDASKPVNEASPARYLVLPFQARMGDPLQGIFIPEASFEQWCKEIPYQSEHEVKEGVTATEGSSNLAGVVGVESVGQANAVNGDASRVGVVEEKTVEVAQKDKIDN